MENYWVLIGVKDAEVIEWTMVGGGVW